MRHLAHCLIAEEFRIADPFDAEGRAAFRVCEKLRQPLSLLAGPAGFRSLLSRAHSLAKADVPWLADLNIAPDGTILFTAEVEAILGRKRGTDGGAAVIAQMLGLLVLFIGEDLTLRLLQQAWPKMELKNFQSGTQL